MSGPHIGDLILRAAGATACPAWCVRHDVNEDSSVIHHGVVTVGEVSVDLEQHGDGSAAQEVSRVESPGGTVVLADNTDMNGQTLRDYIAALTAAADLLDGGTS